MSASPTVCSDPLQIRLENTVKGMENQVPNDATIRDYLLGRIDSETDLAKRFDELMFSSGEFSESIDVIEDEIIEGYLEGTLSAADKKAVESHFLQPPERQRKLREARLLSRCFSSAARDSMHELHSATRERRLPFSLLNQSRLRFSMYVGIAAIALLTFSSVYLLRSRQQLDAEFLRSAQNLVQEHERSSNLSRQLAAARELAQPATVMLSLVQPGRRRSGEALPALRMGAGTTKIHVEIALRSPRGGEYNVQLETSGKIAWSQDKIQAFSSPEGAILIFDVPAQVLTMGESMFVISQKNGNETHYAFTTSTE